ncbi:pentapeptide repeat-containing protein [Arthrobacter sp. Z1-15]
MTKENEKYRRRRPQMAWWTLGAGVFVACSVYLLVAFPRILVAQSLEPGSLELNASEMVKAINDARQGILLAIGGFIAIVTLLFTRLKHILDERKLVLEQDANWTDRYTAAVAQLGAESSVSIRLGGIYSLERIAQDSPRDRQTVLDLLCAYLRDKSPTTAKIEEGMAVFATDCAAAATVVTRITQLSAPTNVVDLHSADLSGTNLSGANLKHANLEGANLRSADLSNVNLSGAKLDKANFTKAKLAHALLGGARLQDANLTSATLNHAYLQSANLSRANLTRAELIEANLTGADITKAVLNAAALSRANLKDASIYQSSEFGVSRVPVTGTYLKEQGALEVHSVKGLPATELETATSAGVETI